MKKVAIFIAMLTVVSAVAFVGCAKKAANSSEAIETAKAMESVEQQAKYLSSQAESFLKSEEYNEAIKTANYILKNVDKSSEDAKKIIEEAKAELKALGGKKLDEVKGKLGIGG